MYKKEGHKLNSIFFAEFLTYCVEEALVDPRVVDKAFAIAADMKQENHAVDESVCWV